MLRALDARGVRYVIIGGVAARAHGDQALTYDLDITHRPRTGQPRASRGSPCVTWRRTAVAGLEVPVPFDFAASSIARLTSMAPAGASAISTDRRQPRRLRAAVGQRAARARLRADHRDRQPRRPRRRAALPPYETGAQRLADLGSRRAPSAPTNRALKPTATSPRAGVVATCPRGSGPVAPSPSAGSVAAESSSGGGHVVALVAYGAQSDARWATREAYRR